MFNFLECGSNPQPVAVTDTLMTLRHDWLLRYQLQLIIIFFLRIRVEAMRQGGPSVKTLLSPLSANVRNIKWLISTTRELFIAPNYLKMTFLN